MNLLRSYSYRKLEKEDPDERRHIKARFLIYKVLEEAELCQRKQPLKRLVISWFKLNFGLRLKKLGRVRVCVRLTLMKQAKQWKQLLR